MKAAPRDATDQGPRSFDLAHIALFSIGATLMAGHVQAGLGRFGPVALVPMAAYGTGLLAFVLALPGRLHATKGLLVCGVALVLALPAILQAAPTEYGTSKVTAFVQLTLLFALMGALLVDNLEDVERFWNGVIAMGMLGLAVSMLDLASGVNLGVRGSINEAFLNPISIGRVGAVAALWYGFGGFPNVPKLWRYASVAMGITLVVAAASRGPMLALLLAGIVSAVRSRVIRGRLAVAVLVAAIAVTAGVGQSVISEASERVIEADRTTSAGEADETSRAQLWAQGTSALLDAPIGRGLAQFGEGGSGDGAAPYPHNVIIEIGLEMGFIAIVVVVFAWWRIARFLWSHPDEQRATRHLALLVFWTVAAMFSSDLNGNRVLLGSILALSVVVLNSRSFNQERQVAHNGPIAHTAQRR